MTAYEAAQKLQNAYYMAVQNKDHFFYVSHVLGSDWAAYRSREFAGKPERYLEIVREEAEMKFGTLPFDPFDI